MINISSVKDKTGKQMGKFWLLVVNKATNMSWSWFLKHKNDQIEPLINFVKELRKTKKKTATYIHCDNAGENKTIQQGFKQEGFGTTFKFTSANTPQQNGKVERLFATTYG